MSKTDIDKLLKSIWGTREDEVIDNLNVIDAIYPKIVEATDSFTIVKVLLYQAGKIHGMKEERERRKAKELKAITV
jgi:hypothetical protein